MDGLASFEKELLLDKAKREQEELQQDKKRHRHHHHHRHHQHQHHRHHSTTGEHRQRDETSRERKSKDGNRDQKRESRPSDKDANRRDRSHDQSPGGGSNHRRKRLRHSRNDDDVQGGNYQRRRQDDEGADTHEAEEGAAHDPTYLQAHDPKEDLPAPDEEKPLNDQPLRRDSWMTAPSGVQIDYIHRSQKKAASPPQSRPPRHEISERELNSDALRHLNRGQTIDELVLPAQPTVNYTFGDEGSQWRMVKLDGVYTVAEHTGRSVDEVAVERFGSLQEFDDAREEKNELERKRLYGKGYAAREKPTGDLYRERLARHASEASEFASARKEEAGAARRSSSAADTPLAAAPVDQTTLNRLRAQLMKAKLRKAPDVAQLEGEFNKAMAAFSAGTGGNTTTTAAGAEKAVVLDATHSRMLAGTRGEVKAVETRRGRERGLVEANDEMSVEDMVREERRTRGVAGGEGRQLAERIAKDAKYDDDLDYLDENAEKLAKHVHKSGANLKTLAVHEYTKMNRILDSCPLCYHEDRQPPQSLPLAPVVSLATRAFLTLPTEPELTGAEGGAVIVPVDHHTNLLECDDDEWEEVRNFMKSLTRMYHDQGRDVIFYENAAAPQRRLHAAMVAVPIPYELGETAPAFFKEAMVSADEEWSQHKKIIDTGKRAREGLGKSAFRKSLAKEMPYFHAWFTIDGGVGHIVEDADRWPKGDLFAREIVGGMLDVDASVIKRQGRWVRHDPRLDDFKKRWKKFDWTRVLTD
ncbi:Cwf19-like, C-terminal domain-1 [Niveomyces insectorum RCEF 264]|uniref:Cwf19-like, C-terminal domain-1 n=1 Tax=Niveomyces insectorum RCEF 264 TaxID=1081102 RepID=A0A167XMD4_9HYPO|nr:Cwf19-like, C-terminal domain-1 [Niveomyces insectorum RCEF 264]